jgi:peroxin-6
MTEQPQNMLHLLKQGTTCKIPDASGPYEQLLTLASAAFVPRASDYDIQLSILIKGAAGVGKSTTVLWVAQTLGMHTLEASQFTHNYNHSHEHRKPD